MAHRNRQVNGWRDRRSGTHCCGLRSRAIAESRTAIPALLTTVSALTSEAVAREVVAATPTSLGPEDQDLVEDVKAILRRVVAQHVPVTTEAG